MWSQVYNPLNNAALSTLVAALPIVVLLGLLAWWHVRAHYAALAGLATSLLVATVVIGMPVGMAMRAAAYGAAYGLFPIGWIVLNVLFLYRLVDERGLLADLRGSITGVTRDTRLQLLLIAFCFGAFFEGAAGFGTPVAVTGAMLIGLGFPPLQASAFSLIANTAPVAFGGLGTPIIALQGVTGLDLRALSAMIGRQLPFFSVIVPFWLIWAYAGFRGMREVWPALLVAGLAFALPQFFVSNLHGPWLVDIVASLTSIAVLTWFLRHWRPATLWEHPASGVATGEETLDPGFRGDDSGGEETLGPGFRRDDEGGGRRGNPWLPWGVLSLVVFVWGIPQVKAWLNGLSVVTLPVAGLDGLVQRVAPVVTTPTREAAVFTLNWLSATGSAILIAAVIAGLIMRYSPARMAGAYWRTIVHVRHSLITIAAMLALGYTTRYSGGDAILGLAFARSGVLYPFFGTMLGWLGVALTGSDTSSNVLFGSLQTITAGQVGVSPILMAAANSSGGVMGKMIDAQSIVVASTATRWYGHEGRILRFVFWHSLALAALMGLLVFLQAYVPPLSWMAL